MNESLPQRPENGPKRITWGLIGSDILNVLNFEKGVLFTIKGLFRNPKIAVDDYLYGNRSSHANPLRFLLISTAIVSLLNYYLILKPSLEDTISGNKQTEQSTQFEMGKEFGKSLQIEMGSDDDENSKIEEEGKTAENEKPKTINEEDEKRIIRESLKELFQWMDKFTFATVPIFSFFTFLFFRKSGYNFTENLVINAFMVSMTNVFGIVILIPTYYYPGVGGLILAIITIGYMVFYMKDVFALPGFKGYVTATATFILSYSIYILIMAAALIYLVVDYVQALQL